MGAVVQALSARSFLIASSFSCCSLYSQGRIDPFLSSYRFLLLLLLLPLLFIAFKGMERGIKKKPPLVQKKPKAIYFGVDIRYGYQPSTFFFFLFFFLDAAKKISFLIYFFQNLIGFADHPPPLFLPERLKGYYFIPRHLRSPPDAAGGGGAKREFPA